MSKAEAVQSILSQIAAPPDAAEAPEAATGAPIAESGAQEAADPTAGMAEGAPEADVDPKEARKARLREGIKEVRERKEANLAIREAKRLLSEAQAAKEEAARELEQVRTAPKKGWKTALAEWGFNPLEVFDQMTQEALRAGTPEAQAESLREQVMSMVAPLQEEIATLRQREELAQQQHYEASLRSAVIEKASDPSYQCLSIYEPAELLEAVRLVGDRLTSAGERVTVGEILDVLKLQQERYDERVAKARGTQSRTVNGTVARQAETLGNASVSQMLPQPEPHLSKAERVQRLIKRSLGE